MGLCCVVLRVHCIRSVCNLMRKPRFSSIMLGSVHYNATYLIDKIDTRSDTVSRTSYRPVLQPFRSGHETFHDPHASAFSPPSTRPHPGPEIGHQEQVKEKPYWFASTDALQLQGFRVLKNESNQESLGKLACVTEADMFLFLPRGSRHRGLCLPGTSMISLQ
jgi:hypothetical protein